MSYLTLLAEHHRTSRGHVHCDACARTIAKDTRYYEARVCDYRDIWTWRQCPACSDAISWAHDGDYDTDCGPECLQEWADDMLDAHLARHVDTLVHCLTVPDLHAPARTLTRIGEMARQEVADLAELDRTHPLTAPEAVAAFTWRMRTSPALHPDGITNTPEETHP